MPFDRRKCLLSSVLLPTTLGMVLSSAAPAFAREPGRTSDAPVAAVSPQGIRLAQAGGSDQQRREQPHGAQAAPPRPQPPAAAPPHPAAPPPPPPAPRVEAPRPPAAQPHTPPPPQPAQAQPRPPAPPPAAAQRAEPAPQAPHHPPPSPPVQPAQAAPPRAQPTPQSVTHPASAPVQPHAQPTPGSVRDAEHANRSERNGQPGERGASDPSRGDPSHGGPSHGDPAHGGPPQGGVAQRPPSPPGVPQSPYERPIAPPPPVVAPPPTSVTPPGAPAPAVAPAQVAPIGRTGQPPNRDIGRPPQQPAVPSRPGEIPGTRPGINPPPLPQQGSNQPQQFPQGSGRPERRGISPGAAAAIGAAGLVGGVLAGQAISNYNEVRRDRREFESDGTTYIAEPGRLIERRGDRAFIRHDENERFRELGYDARNERRGEDFVTIYRERDGDEIVTVTDPDGRLLRRYRRRPDGREVVLIENDRRPPGPIYEDVVVLPPPPSNERLYIDARDADEDAIYETLTAPPVAPLPRRYSLDEVRYSPDLRARMPRVDVDTITFETGAWTLGREQVERLSLIAAALKKALARNPNEIFLVEGHTDAVGSDVDNLSLSDRRAQAAAESLTRDFGIPPENLVTQGYGEQYLKEQTQGPSRVNRRVTIRRITPLLKQQAG